MFEEPVDHILVRKGFCSLRSAKTFLRNNKVTVNSVQVFERNFPVDADHSELCVNGKSIQIEKHLYFMLNKPLGYVCSTQSDSHKTVYDLFPENIKSLPQFKYLHSCGRLDAETSGLLLFTTNGRFSNFITAPLTHLKKTYVAVLRDSVSEQKMQEMKLLFEKGVLCAEEKKSASFTAKPAELIFLSSNKVSLTIYEGKFHQVRRMFSAVGNEVIELKRISIGKLKLPENLKENEIVSFLPEELC